MQQGDAASVMQLALSWRRAVASAACSAVDPSGWRDSGYASMLSGLLCRLLHCIGSYRWPTIRGEGPALPQSTASWAADTCANCSSKSFIGFNCYAVYLIHGLMSLPFMLRMWTKCIPTSCTAQAFPLLFVCSASLIDTN